MTVQILIDLEPEFIEDLNDAIKNSLAENYTPRQIKRAQTLIEDKCSQIRVEVLGDEVIGHLELGSGKIRTATVGIDLPLFGREYGLYRCSCLGDAKIFEEVKCEHLAAIELSLSDYIEGTYKQKILDPESRLDLFLKEVESIKKNQKEKSSITAPFKYAFSFELETSKIQPIRVYSKTNKDKHDIKQSSWKQVFKDFEILANEDRVALAFVNRDDEFPIHDCHGFIRSLAYHEGKFFLKAASGYQAFKVSESTPLFSLKKTITNAESVFSIVAVIGESCLTNFELATLEDDLLLCSPKIPPQESPAQCYLLKISPRVLQFIKSLDSNPMEFREKEIANQIDKLISIQKLLPVDLNVLPTKTLLSEFIVRITPFETGASKIEFLTKTFNNYHPNASGPVEIFAKRGLDILRFVRDLDEERYFARRMRKFLNLDFVFSPEENTFILPNIACLLSLVDRMNRLPEKSGILLEWPKNKSTQQIQQLTIANAEPDQLNVKIENKNGWFQFHGKVEIDGTVIELKELLKSISENQKYVQLSEEKWLKLSEKLRKRLKTISAFSFEDTFGLTAKNAIIASENDTIIDIADEVPKELLAARNTLKTKQYFPVPKDLHANLRHYQIVGFQWMRSLYEWSMGGCLADDMGLGKTLQAIALLLDVKQEGRSLIICPTSLISNWAQEIHKFAPNLKSSVYWGPNRHKESLLSSSYSDVIITSYGTALNDQDTINSYKWNVIVFDEAQAVKNSKTNQAQLIQSVQARCKFALSGTPIENNLSELWSILHAISPRILGPWNSFQTQFVQKIEEPNRDHSCTPTKARLQDIIKPFVLRRLKQDYLHELPDKQICDLRIQLSEDEMKFYEAARQLAIEEFDDRDDKTENENTKAPDGTRAAKASTTHVLASLSRLRQIACSPHLIDPTWHGPSSKQLAIVDKIKSLSRSGHKILIFSQFTKYLRLIQTGLMQEQLKSLYLDGSHSIAERKHLVDAFQSGSFDCFLISLKAGGSGLNLTAANYVIIADPWWNPAVEKQAQDRAYRMGQSKKVTVYRMIAKGTVEEAIYKLHRRKQDLSDSIFKGEMRQKQGMKREDMVDLLLKSRELIE